MPFIPVPNTAQVRMQFRYATQQCENVYHVLSPSGWGVAELTLLAETFRDWWINDIGPIVPSSLILDRVLAQDLTVEGAPAIEFTTGLPAPGLSVTESLPNNVTVAVKWSTGLAGRSFRGRTYHLGLSDAGVVNNTLTAGAINQLTVGYNALIAEVNSTADDWVLVVVSKYSGVDGDGNPIPRASGLATQILAASVDAIVDSQRRRLPGRGN